MRRNRRRNRVIDDSISLLDEAEDNGPLIIISEEEEEFDAVPAAAQAEAILPPQAMPAAAPAAPAPAAADASDDAGFACTICLELMADAGEHRPAALRCGHIFGVECIKRWLAARRPGKCPQCNKNARSRDVTLLYNLPKLAGTVVLAAGSSAADSGGGGRSSSSSQLEQQLQEERRKREVAEARLQQIASDLEQQRRLLQRPQLQMQGCPPHYQHHPQQHQQQQQPGYRSNLQQYNSSSSTSRSRYQEQYSSEGPLAERHHSHSRQGQRTHPYRRSGGGSGGEAAAAAAGEWPLYPPSSPSPRRSAQQREQQREQQLAGAARDGHRPSPAAAAAAAAEARAASVAAGVAAPAAPPPAPAAAATATLAAPHAVAAIPPAQATANNVGAAPTRTSQTQQQQQVASQAQQQQQPQQQQQQQRRQRLLALLPVQRATAAGAAAAAGRSGAPAVRQLPGSFMALQTFTLNSSRSFLLDVPGTQLLAAEHCPGSSSSKLRRISLLCPDASSYISLPPGCGVVRSLAAQPLLKQQDSGAGGEGPCKCVAVATERAGLLITSLGSSNVIQSIPLKLPVWSVAWARTHSMQLLLGLDKGRAALADLRMTGDRAILAMTGSSSSSSSSRQQQQQQQPNMPLHSVVALDGVLCDTVLQGEQQEQRPDALVACTGGVFAWSSAAPDAFQLLLPSKAHGGTCESLTAAPASAAGAQLVAASFRAPLAAAAGAPASNLGWAGPTHILAQVGCLDLDQQQQQGSMLLHDPPQQQQQPGDGAAAAAAGDVALAAAVLSGRQQLMQQTLQLRGHSSRRVMTRSCFLPHPLLPSWLWEGEQAVLLSADEQSCCPVLWGCSSGSMFTQRQAWQPLTQPVLQLSGGYSSGLGSLLLGALCEQQLVLYAWEPEC